MILLFVNSQHVLVIKGPEKHSNKTYLTLFSPVYALAVPQNHFFRECQHCKRNLKLSRESKWLAKASGGK